MARIAGNVCNTYIHIDLLVEEIKPKYTLGEEIMNAITHGIGAALAIARKSRNLCISLCWYQYPNISWDF